MCIEGAFITDKVWMVVVFFFKADSGPGDAANFFSMLTQANHTRCKETNRLRWIKHVIIEHNEQQSSSTISHETPLNTTKHRPSSNNIINDQTSILQTSWDFQVPLETIFSILHIISYVIHSTKTPIRRAFLNFSPLLRSPRGNPRSTWSVHIRIPRMLPSARRRWTHGNLFNCKMMVEDNHFSLWNGPFRGHSLIFGGLLYTQPLKMNMSSP